MTISNYLENKILDHVTGTATYTAPATVYVSLHSADPGETGDSELTNAGGSAYARQAGAWNSASSGSKTNSNTMTYSNMPAVTSSHLGLWDASSGGNFLGGGPLASSRTTELGDTLVLDPTTGVVFTLD